MNPSPGCIREDERQGRKCLVVRCGACKDVTVIPDAGLGIGDLLLGVLKWREFREQGWCCPPCTQFVGSIQEPKPLPGAGWATSASTAAQTAFTRGAFPGMALSATTAPATQTGGRAWK